MFLSKEVQLIFSWENKMLSKVVVLVVVAVGRGGQCGGSHGYGGCGDCGGMSVMVVMDHSGFAGCCDSFRRDLIGGA